MAAAQAAMVAQAEAAALAQLAALDVEPIANPLAALAQLTGDAFAWKAMLDAHVAQLGQLTGPDHLGDERVRVRVQLLERAMDRCQRFATAMAGLDIDGRLAELQGRVTEAQGAQLVAVIRAVLAELGHAPDDPAVGAVVARQLRAIHA